MFNERRLTPMLRGVTKSPRRNKMQLTLRKPKFTTQPLAVRQKFWDNALSRMMARPIGMKRPMGSSKLLMGDKLMRRIKRRKVNRDTVEKKRTRGFRVSRFLLHTWPQVNDSQSIFNNAGLLPVLLCKWRPRLRFPSVLPANTDPLTLPLDINEEFTFVSIYAQWPGSRLSFLTQRQQGSTQQPRFGLIPANQVSANNNYQWNTRAVENVNQIYSNAQLAQDKLDLIFRKIIVYKSSLRIELQNNNPTYQIKVHLVHYKVKSYSVQLADGTCAVQTNINTMMNLFVNGKTSPDTTRCKVNFDQCLRMRKLPGTNFITKSWKTVNLGIPNQQGDPTTNTQLQPKSTRTVVFNYGRKEFSRTGCQEEGSLFKDDVLEEYSINFGPTQLMIFHEVDGHTRWAESSDQITTGLNMKIYKTNIWREYN